MFNVDLSKYRVRGNGSIHSRNYIQPSLNYPCTMDRVRIVLTGEKGGFVQVFGKSFLFLYTIIIMRLAMRSG